MKYQFPEDFWWGSATSATQSEGASLQDGKSQNIFDYWYDMAPERFHGPIGPENTSTFYDNYRQDILLLKALGHNTFRTSISWSRLIPSGDGEVNPKAVAFIMRSLIPYWRTGLRRLSTSTILICHCACKRKGAGKVAQW